MPPAAAQPTSERVQQLFDNRSLKTMRTARGTFPGSSFVINFQEFGGLDRRSPLRHRVQDPGGPILTMTVNEFATVMAAVKANGGIVGLGDSSETLAADDVALVAVRSLPVSAREIRQDLAAGASVRYRVPLAVSDYIAQHRLYGG